jgi:hypothetical protein
MISTGMSVVLADRLEEAAVRAAGRRRQVRQQDVHLGRIDLLPEHQLPHRRPPQNRPEIPHQRPYRALPRTRHLASNLCIDNLCVAHSGVRNPRVTDSGVAHSSVGKPRVTDSGVAHSSVHNPRVTDSGVAHSSVGEPRVADSCVADPSVGGAAGRRTAEGAAFHSLAGQVHRTRRDHGRGTVEAGRQSERSRGDLSRRRTHQRGRLDPRAEQLGPLIGQRHQRHAAHRVPGVDHRPIAHDRIQHRDEVVGQLRDPRRSDRRRLGSPVPPMVVRHHAHGRRPEHLRQPAQLVVPTPRRASPPVHQHDRHGRVRRTSRLDM